jgi:CRP-like cAMP-binding protein
MGYLLDELFSSVPLFDGLSNENKKYLSDRIDYAIDKFEDGDLIIEEGMSGTEFFILIKGNALITRNEMPNQVIAQLQAGDIFGEMSYLTGIRRSANVIARGERVLAMKVSRDLMEKMNSEIREIIKDKLIELLVQRINLMNQSLIHGVSDNPEVCLIQPKENRAVKESEKPWWKIWA